MWFSKLVKRLHPALVNYFICISTSIFLFCRKYALTHSVRAERDIPLNLATIALPSVLTKVFEFILSGKIDLGKTEVSQFSNSDLHSFLSHRFLFFGISVIFCFGTRHIEGLRYSFEQTTFSLIFIPFL